MLHVVYLSLMRHEEFAPSRVRVYKDCYGRGELTEAQVMLKQMVLDSVRSSTTAQN